jgi:GNAT superfamily N-acetyltransferase
MMDITYRKDVVPATEAVVSLFESSGIHRPTADNARIAEMFARADLVVTAWDADELVGVARSLTDFCYCCYLSDLAVAAPYQRQGIGKKLVAMTREAAGEQATLILVAAPSAAEYYPGIGMEKLESAFAIRRKR